MNAYLKTLIWGKENEPVFATAEEAKLQGQCASDQGFAIDETPYPEGALHDAWRVGHKLSMDELVGNPPRFCLNCVGSGERKGQPCPECNGTGGWKENA